MVTSGYWVYFPLGLPIPSTSCFSWVLRGVKALKSQDVPAQAAVGAAEDTAALVYSTEEKRVSESLAWDGVSESLAALRNKSMTKYNVWKWIQ